jgi:hypothetical protein
MRLAVFRGNDHGLMMRLMLQLIGKLRGKNIWFGLKEMGVDSL